MELYSFCNYYDSLIDHKVRNLKNETSFKTRDPAYTPQESKQPLKTPHQPSKTPTTNLKQCNSSWKTTLILLDLCQERGTNPVQFEKGVLCHSDSGSSDSGCCEMSRDMSLEMTRDALRNAALVEYCMTLLDCYGTTCTGNYTRQNTRVNK